MMQKPTYRGGRLAFVVISGYRKLHFVVTTATLHTLGEGVCVLPHLFLRG